MVSIQINFCTKIHSSFNFLSHAYKIPVKRRGKCCLKEWASMGEACYLAESLPSVCKAQDPISKHLKTWKLKAQVLQSFCDRPGSWGFIYHSLGSWISLHQASVQNCWVAVLSEMFFRWACYFSCINAVLRKCCECELAWVNYLLNEKQIFVSAVYFHLGKTRFFTWLL